jgi:hypothetical protein
MSNTHRVHHVPLGDGHDEGRQARLRDGLEKGEELYRRKRADVDRRAIAERFRVLKSMAGSTILLGDGKLTTARRVHELREHHVFAALPPRQRAEWERLADEVTELYLEGERAPAWQLAENLAQEQARELEDWEAPDAPESESPAELAAKVPR